MKPSNRSTRPRTRSSNRPASTVTVVPRYSAGVIWQAMNCRRIRSYRRRASASAMAGAPGCAPTSVGRIASWASWAPALLA